MQRLFYHNYRYIIYDNQNYHFLPLFDFASAVCRFICTLSLLIETNNVSLHNILSSFHYPCQG